MKKVIKTFEEFIGMEGIHKYKRANQTWREDEVQVRPALNTNDPQRKYDDESDGKDQINRSVIGKRG